AQPLPVTRAPRAPAGRCCRRARTHERRLTDVIDPDGFRPNVGLIIFNDDGKLLWAKRVGQDAWQCPQGGIRRDERPERAALRELREEVGLEANDVEVVASTRKWLRYRLPEHLIRQRSFPVCIGQK